MGRIRRADCVEAIVSEHRVVVLCLVPAAGHLMCLLKIAAQLRSSATVLVMVPAELEHVAEYYGFASRVFGSVEPPGGASALAAYAEASELGRVTGKLLRLEREHLSPLRAAVRSALPRIASDLLRFDPDFVIADETFFHRDLAQLSHRIQRPVFIHSGAANWSRHNCWSLMSFFFRDARTLAMDAWEKTRHELRLLARSRPGPVRLTEAGEDLCSSAIALPAERAQVTFLSSGLSFLERALLSDQLLYSGEGRAVLPPFPPLERALPPELRAWLDRADRPVAYLSLGTLIARSKAAGEIVQGILDAGHRVLVQGRHDTLSRFPEADTWQEPWLPQATALGHPAVSLVVTHGGSGTLEEALWHGRTSVCMPHAWDQHYNAWICAKLGVSVSVGKRRPGARRRVRAAVEKASDQRLVANARTVSGMMRGCWNERRTDVTDFFCRPR